VTISFRRCLSAAQRKESLTTVSFAVAQFDSSQKPYVAFGNVPLPDDEISEMPAPYQSLNAAI